MSAAEEHQTTNTEFTRRLFSNADVQNHEQTAEPDAAAVEAEQAPAQDKPEPSFISRLFNNAD